MLGRATRQRENRAGAATVSSLSTPPRRPRVSTSRSAIAASAWRSDSRSRACTSLMNLSAARGGIRSVRLTWAGAWPGVERLGDRDRVPQAADHVVDQAGDPLTLLAQLEQQLDRGLLVAGDERVGERPDLLLGRGGAGLDDLLGADRGARAVLERELLELAQQPLLAVADLRDERLRALAVQVDLQRPGLAFQPLRQVPRLDVVLGRDLAADLLDRLVELVRRLVAALLAGEERDRERLGVARTAAP